MQSANPENPWSPPVCPECYEHRLRKLQGRPGVPHDERWICPAAIDERRRGGKGPFIHKGLVYNVSYTVRSPENRARLLAEGAAVVVETEDLKAKGRKKEAFVKSVAYYHKSQAPMIGDCVVSRDMKTVYTIEPTGTWMKLKDPNLIQVMLDVVTRDLEAAREQRAAAVNPVTEAATA